MDLPKLVCKVVGHDWNKAFTCNRCKKDAFELTESQKMFVARQVWDKFEK